MAGDEFPNVPSSEHMTSAQILTIVSLERTGGCVSLAAVMLIFVAYYLFPGVRNVQNTFIVFASVANVGASIASVMARAGLSHGRESSLCQAQSFLFEMFMQSDPWWSLAMAINVFLVFYFRASPDSFQQWWWLYCLICYGGPLIIALALLLVRHPERGPIYGEATIWCWVDREWDDIRIYTYYMLIWICIVGSIVLYFMVGYHVFQSRNQLHSFCTTSKSRDRDVAQTDDGVHIRLPDVPADGFYGTVITEVQVIHSTPSSSSLPASPKKTKVAPAVSFEADGNECDGPVATSQYYSTVTSVPANHRRAQQQRQARRLSRRRRYHRPGGNNSALARSARAARAIMGKFAVDDPIKRAYLRTSVLFALSVLVTWIPSSMNRIHSWLTGESPYEFHVATAAVLPLQGLWNAVIFFVTSGTALRKGWKRWRGHSEGGPGGSMPGDEEEGGVGGAARRSAARNNEGREDSDEEEVGRLVSDVELRRMAEAHRKNSSSTA